MKTLITITSALILLMMAHNSLASTSKEVSCSYQGIIKSRAKDAHTARKLVADKCFDMHLDKYERDHGGNLPDDIQGTLIAEACTNQTTCR